MEKGSKDRESPSRTVKAQKKKIFRFRGTDNQFFIIVFDIFYFKTQKPDEVREPMVNILNYFLIHYNSK